MPEHHDTDSQRRRSTLFSDEPPAAGAQQAPKAAHRDGEHTQAQPDRPALRVTRGKGGPSKDAPQEARPRGADGTGNSGESQAGKGAGEGRAVPNPAASESAGTVARAETAGRADDTSHSKRPADVALADERLSHSKRPKPEADPRRPTSTASEVEASHANRLPQGRESADRQRARSRDSKASLSQEDGRILVPQRQDAEKPHQRMHIPCLLHDMSWIGSLRAWTCSR